MSTNHFKIDNWNIGIGTALDTVSAMTSGQILHTNATIMCHGEGYILYIYFMDATNLSKATPVTDFGTKRASICLPYESLEATLSLLNSGRILYGLVHNNAAWNNLTDNWNM